MRFLRLLSAVLLCVFANEQSYAQTVMQQADPQYICREQEILVTVWQSQGVVWSVDYHGDRGEMEVSPRRWLSMTYNAQEKLALAAYCRIGTQYGRGVLTVENYGRVVDGRWHNRLTGG